MKKQIILNVIYLVGIMVSLKYAIETYRDGSPLITIFCVAVLLTLIYFKLQLYKDVRKNIPQNKDKK
ncbi:MAG: hypothetical protein EOO99_07545 [Pedobacter sp.]|nr:MAG: hypothetical protein EOO99_07545 [Pedobacter sp.]